MKSLVGLRMFGIGFVLVATTMGTYGVLIGASVLLVCELVIAWHRHGPPIDTGRKAWFQRIVRRRTPPPAMPTYGRVVDAIGGAGQSRFDFDHQLRPMLTDAAACRLEDNHGVDLHTDPDAARRLLGAEVWELLDPGREARRDRSMPGPDRARLERMVARIEEL